MPSFRRGQRRSLDLGRHGLGLVLIQEAALAELQPVESELDTDRLGAVGAAGLCTGVRTALVGAT